MANPLAGYGISDRDYATVVGTMMGEALNEGVKGMAAVADVIANRKASEDTYGRPLDSSLAGTALASRPSGKGKEFDAWNASVAPAAYVTATTAARAAVDPTYASTLSRDFQTKLEQAHQAAMGVLGTGTLRGITLGSTFYNNPAATSARMNSVMDDQRTTGSVRIGNHVFGGPEFDQNKTFDQKAALEKSWSEYQNSFNTPTEKRVMDENMARQRDVFRGPSDFGAPVWDGTVDQAPTLAAPVSPVESAPLADLYNPGTAPGPDLGANLNSAVTASDLTPSISPYGFSSMSYSPGMGQVQGQLSQEYAGTVPGGGTFAPDTSFAPGPDLGANLSNSLPSSDFSPSVSAYGFSGLNAGSMADPASMSTGITPEAAQPSIGSTSFSGLNTTPAGTWGGFGSGITPTGTPSIDTSYSAGRAMTSPQTMDYGGVPMSLSAMNGAFGLTGITGTPTGTTATNVMGMDGITAKPNTAAATQPELPGFELPAEVPAPTIAPQVTTRPEITQSVPSRSTAAPSRSVGAPPALSPPQSISTPTVKEASPAPSQTYADALAGFSTPGGFLGGVMSGNRGAVDALSGLTGTNYGGLAQQAMSGDQYAQPAMLGLMNAYANATGTTAPQSLFGGWGNSVQNDNLGAVVDQATGKTLGMADPSDPARNNGFFGSLFGGWGWGGNDNGGMTPGSGGLY